MPSNKDKIYSVITELANLTAKELKTSKEELSHIPDMDPKRQAVMRDHISKVEQIDKKIDQTYTLISGDVSGVKAWNKARRVKHGRRN